MTTKTNQTIPQLDMIIVSDVHLRDEEDERAQRLLSLLRGISGPGPGYLLLLGDIFDFCLGDSAFFRAKFATLGQEVERIAAGGTRVVFFEGNHEFSMSHMGWQSVEFTDDEFRIFVLPDGTRIKAGHGDFIKRDLPYFAFRALLKSRAVQWIAATMPQTWLNQYTLRHAHNSRAKNDQRHLDTTQLVASAQRWTLRDSCHIGVFGHFHESINVPSNTDGLGSVHCAPGWDSRPGYFRIKGNHVEWAALV